MKPVLSLLLLVSLSACAAAQKAVVEDFDGSALADTYAFGIAEAPNAGCQLMLKVEPMTQAFGQVARPVKLGAACRKYVVLREITQWAATGAGSVALVGGDKRADFSPVQGGAGVYLRGGFPGDPNVYELRPAQ